MVAQSKKLANAITNAKLVFEADKVCNACFELIDGKKRVRAPRPFFLLLFAFDLVGAGSTQCSRCRAVYYCSGECQSSDWPKHKTSCKPAI